METRVGLGGVGSGGGSRYKVTARCVPEVSITSPTDGHYHELQPPSSISSASPSTPSPQQAATSHVHSPQLTNHHSTEQLLPKATTQSPHQQQHSETQHQPQSHHKQQHKQHKKSKSKSSSNSNSHCYSNYNYNNINSINKSNSHSQSQSQHSHNSSNSKSYPLRSKHTNDIYSSGATLVEEEDFNELTAVPRATIVIATNANGIVRVSSHTTANGSIGTGVNTGTSTGTGKGTRRQLPPPLKLTAATTSSPTTITAPTKNVLQRQRATQQQQQQHASPTSATLKLTTQASEESQPTELTPLVDADDITLSQSPITPTPSSNTNTASSTQRSNSTAIAASVSPTSVGVAAASQFGGGLTPATSTATIIATVGAANSSNVYGQQCSVPSASTVPPPTVVAAAAAAAATTTTYSHNSKTTRSWPVIYRNPHHYDYEALYVQATSGSGKPSSGSNHHYYHQPPNHYQISSTGFKQNCYSNQFAQSILYTSSNEDLSAINEQGGSVGGLNGVAGGTSGGSSTFGIGNGHSNLNNTNSNTQTTCYYFAPSRHNSIYEHPSAVVHNSLPFDPSAATTAAAAAAVESLRRSNSILLRNSSCAKALNQSGGGIADGTGGGLGTPTSLNSAMEMGSGTGATSFCSNCCVGPPPVLFLFVTLLMTTSATAMLCAAIMTDHWEHVTWDRNSLDRYTNRSSMQLEWMLNDKVAMLKPDKKGK
ncbi:mucin-2 [Anastrepha ludens]|uniref:mucin-2 n=1 Tax=Anastrepha ludens TaxID=28586 RepID=UPI0023B1DBA3|nr:mucin-2 [Anastrepha ludens]